MKTAIVLCGSQLSIIRQAKELNGYIRYGMGDPDEIDVWILSEQGVDMKSISLPEAVSRVSMMRIRTTHVPECVLEGIVKLFECSHPFQMVFGSDAFLAGIAARAAYRLNGSSCIGVTSSRIQENSVTVEKPVYSNNLTARFRLSKMPYCISIAKGFVGDQGKTNEIPFPKIIELTEVLPVDWIVSYRLTPLLIEDGLSSAKLVIAVGNGVGSKDNIPLFQELADLLGGKLGATRPVVMNAWTGMDRLIGVSGTMLSPELCITMGASGAAAFTAGIMRSKCIVAINKDPKARIFKNADIGICGDCQEIAEELIRLMKN